MVERPIKKSERLAKEAAGGHEEPATQPSADDRESGSRPTRSSRPNRSGGERPNRDNSRDNDRDRRRGKGGRKEGKSDDKPPVNLALMRGPKPTQSKPPVEEAPPSPIETGEAGDIEADVEADPVAATEEPAIEAGSDAAEPSN
ncbi:hypothetical protein [Thermocoleostomius sinensis]|uniref:Uncharacterized protein n=1 Tax=Thermocoleostomius sinensis A174 TaxID=2016057 RepID=A0A9E8ZM63_9CYAN|nr:hypothetical protein [Thermocoleostomius sinensis]WAL61031.1 hypothetical protein OXH18_03245 [Thermocoleostomius sinensis A174]